MADQKKGATAFEKEGDGIEKDGDVYISKLAKCPNVRKPGQSPARAAFG